LGYLCGKKGWSSPEGGEKKGKGSHGSHLVAERKEKREFLFQFSSMGRRKRTVRFPQRNRRIGGGRRKKWVMAFDGEKERGMCTFGCARGVARTLSASMRPKGGKRKKKEKVPIVRQ